MENKAANEEPIVVLTSEMVSRNLEKLAGAAAKGHAKNALYDLVTKARNELASSATPEGIVDANEKVMGQWMSIQQKNMEEGKDPTVKNPTIMDTINSFLDGGIFSGLFFVMKDKIAILAETAVETWKNKDERLGFGNIFAQKTQEHNIRNFAARHGIDGDRLLAEIKNPPKETELLASLTKDDQIQRLNDIKVAEEQKTAQARADADKAEAERLVRIKIKQDELLQRQEELRKKELQANVPGQSGSPGAGGKVENKGDERDASIMQEEKKGKTDPIIVTGGDHFPTGVSVPSQSNALVARLLGSTFIKQ